MSELKIDLYLSNHTIRMNVSAYKGCTAQMKHVTNINFNISSTCLNGEIFRNKELWEIGHVLDAMRHTHRILDSNYEESNLSKMESQNKHLTEEERTVLHTLITKYDLLFYGT